MFATHRAFTGVVVTGLLLVAALRMIVDIRMRYVCCTVDSDIRWRMRTDHSQAAQYDPNPYQCRGGRTNRRREPFGIPENYTARCCREAWSTINEYNRSGGLR